VGGFRQTVADHVLIVFRQRGQTRTAALLFRAKNDLGARA
jgi:hypothetical protein